MMAIEKTDDQFDDDRAERTDVAGLRMLDHPGAGRTCASSANLSMARGAAGRHAGRRD